MTQSSLDSKSIFARALEIENAAEREQFLQQACHGDPALRAEIGDMLELHDQAGGFMQSPGAFAPTALKSARELIEKPGSHVGPYKLLQQIGEGGMGTVFMAEQEHPVRRKVALKIIKPGMDSGQVIARFEAERQALAMMDHTNIAKVLDAGTTDTGRPYFVMELVHGVPITDYCDANHLTHRERLELFVPVCQALQHAHQKGIIHRDVKPSNILITQYDDKPVPKVIDFGVAKAVEHRLTEKTLFTQYGTLVGTFEYMSPEQAELNAFGVDTRSDVYSLGVLLYELLTGTTPLEKARLRQAAYGELVRIIKEEEPPKPSVRISSSGSIAKLAAACKTDASKLSSLVKGELDWIVMKCLEKDRTRRYDGANALAKDVNRYLSGEAVEACPPTLSYRLQKLYRKNRIAVLVGSTIGVVLTLASVVSLAFGIQAKRAEHLAALSAKDARQNEQIANQQRDEADGARLALVTEQNARAWSDYVWSIQFAQAAWQQHQFEPARRFLDRTPVELRGWEWHYLNRLCKTDELYSLETEDGYISTAQYSKDGRWIVTAGSSVQVWNTTTRQPINLCSVAGMANVDISPDGEQILVSDINKVTVWDRESRSAQPPIVVAPDGLNPFYARFSPDGTKIVIAWSNGRGDDTEVETISLWDAKTRQRLWSHKARDTRNYGASFAADGHWVYSMVWDPLAVEPSKRGNILKIWDVDTGEELLAVGQKFMWAYLSPDGTRLAAQDRHNDVSVWRIRREGNRPILDDDPIVLRGHTGLAAPRTFSRDSKYLLTVGGDDTVRIWDAATGAQVRVLVGAGFGSADFSPDAKHVVTTGGRHEEGTRVWAVEEADSQIASEEDKKVFTSLPSPDGRLLLSFDPAGARILDAETGTLLHTLASGRGGWSPDGKRIWISSSGNPASETTHKVSIYNAETGQLLRELEGVETPPLDHYCFNADGSQVLTVREDGSVHVWDVNTGQIWELARLGTSGFPVASYSPDGTRIYVVQGGEQRTPATGISILDAVSRQPIVELDTSGSVLRSNGTFSQDGRMFLGLFANSESSGIDCKVWDATTGKQLRSFPTNAWSMLTLQISPDGSRILIACFLDKVLLIDAKSGDELLALPINGLRTAKFDRDGNRIIVNDGDKVRILDGTPMAEEKN